MKFFEKFNLIKEILNLQKVTVSLWGGAQELDLFRRFTAPHPRFPFVKNKSLGVALLPVPAGFDEYLHLHARVRKNRNRAIRRGYWTERVNPLECLDAILAVNLSMPVRQGRTIDEPYTNREKLAEFYRDVPSILVARNRDGEIRAYTQGWIVGEIIFPRRILGHTEDLENGIMYLLFSEMVKEAIQIRNDFQSPKWVMYDTMFGANPGMRMFKELLGFRAYRVKWAWTPRASS